MIHAPTAKEAHVQELVRSIKMKSQASNELLSSETTGLRLWELPFALIVGILVAAITYFLGQPVLAAASVGVAVAALNIAVACVAETRRLNRRLNALLQIHSALESPSIKAVKRSVLSRSAQSAA